MPPFLLLLCSVALLAGCASQPVHPWVGSQKLARPERVWLVSNGFHTSIAIRAQDAPPGYRAMDAKARYFVIGWGGRDLYMKGRVMPWEWLTTTILPTASALHVIPIRTGILEECPNSEVIEFDVTPRGIARLQKRLRLALDRDERGEPLIAGPGKIARSRFLSGSEVYYLPKTCNLWAAASLQSAGVPLHVGSALAAGNLIRQGRKYGRTLANYNPPADPL
jgi:hypothetical protein